VLLVQPDLLAQRVQPDKLDPPVQRVQSDKLDRLDRLDKPAKLDQQVLQVLLDQLV
jgi:hypothetical protein